MPLSYIGKTQGFPSEAPPATQRLILNDLDEFCNCTTHPEDPLLDLAIAHATRKFMLPTSVKMKHLNNVFKMESEIWNKSPGLP